VGKTDNIDTEGCARWRPSSASYLR